MRAKIKLQLHSALPTPTTLQIHPEMTSKELAELICASTLLHSKGSQCQKGQLYPCLVVSSHKNLLIDYLLTSTQMTVARIYHLEGQIDKGGREKKYQYLNSLHFDHPLRKRKVLEQIEPFILEVLYKENTKTTKKIRQIFRYIRVDDSRKHLQDPSPKRYLLSRMIQMKTEGCVFMERRMLAKNIIKSFNDMNNLMLIKEKLTKFMTLHLGIFGKVETISTNQQFFIYSFRYVPSISLKQLLKINLSHGQVRYLIDKIWIFLKHMGDNGFEGYLIRLAEREQLGYLLDNIQYDLNGTFFIPDVSLILEENNSIHRMSERNEKQLVFQIQNYIPSRSYKESGFSQQSQSIDIYDFYTVFSKKQFAFQSYQEEEDWIVNYYTWKHQEQTNSVRKMMQASTTKKSRGANISLRNSKTRKGEYQVPNQKRGKTKKKNKQTINKNNLSCFK